MSLVAGVVFVSVLAAVGGQEASGQSSMAEPAVLSFVSGEPVAMSAVHGIDAVDGMPRFLDERRSASVSAGLKTISYSCPGMPQTVGGARISFDFAAGGSYELVCEEGQPAVIRQSENC